MSRFVIDRFEGDYAVLENENGEVTNILHASLPVSCREGDVLVLNGTSYSVDVEETKRRSERNKNLLNKLFDGN